MITQISHLIAATEMATAKPNNSRTVTQLVQSGKCLIPGCECDAKKRGLCLTHYSRFIRERNAMAIRERVQFELDQIHDGLILEVGRQRQIRNPSPFKKKGA